MLRSLIFCALLAMLAGCASDPTTRLPPPKLTGPTVQYAKATPAPAPTYNRTTPKAANPYEYLKPAPKIAPGNAWAPQVKATDWNFIVIHHSDTPTGSAGVFDRYHREVKHWDSLGYHFVIGNGTASKDGQVEVGPRWARQQQGAHAGVEKYNKEGIGICLVGEFDRTRPSAAQMQSLARLVAYLQKTYRIPSSNVIGHGNFRHTNCPGRFMDLAQVRRMAVQVAAFPYLDPMYEPDPTRVVRGGEFDGELMHDIAK